MNERVITVVIGIVVLWIAVMILIKLLKNIPPKSQQESLQHDVDKFAPSPGNQGGSKGRGVRAMVVIILLAISLGLALAYSSGNLDFHI
jgi:hypothetical protein